MLDPVSASKTSLSLSRSLVIPCNTAQSSVISVVPSASLTSEELCSRTTCGIIQLHHLTSRLDSSSMPHIMLSAYNMPQRHL